MVVPSSGMRSRTRRKLSKRVGSKGSITIGRQIQKFDIGQKVNIIPEPGIQSSIPHRRFFGRSGTVVKKQGHSYAVEVKDGGKRKVIFCLPVHLRRVG